MIRFFALLAIMSLSLFASRTMLLGSGFFPETNWLATGLFSLFILLTSGSKKAFFALLLPICLCYLCYLPIGMSFGSPSYQYVASVFATDLQESREFLAQIPLKNIALALTAFLSLLAIRFLCQRFQWQFQRNRTVVALTLFLLFLNTPPAKFLQEGTESILKVKAELTRLNAMAIESGWGQSRLTHRAVYDLSLIHI